MKKSLLRILSDVKRFHRGCKSRLLYDDYKRKIDRIIATDGEKKLAILELTRLMELKP
jgi:hypothetical protein